MWPRVAWPSSMTLLDEALGSSPYAWHVHDAHRRRLLARLRGDEPYIRLHERARTPRRPVYTPSAAPSVPNAVLDEHSLHVSAARSATSATQAVYTASQDVLREHVIEHRVLAPAERVLRTAGLRVLPVDADGDCLFSAAAAQLWGDPAQGKRLRQLVADYMSTGTATTRAFYSRLIHMSSDRTAAPPDDGELDRYTTTMRLQGTWGGAIELIALQEIFDRAVHVYTYASSGALQMTSLASDDASSLRVPVEVAARAPLRFLYTNGSHYDAIVPERNAQVRPWQRGPPPDEEADNAVVSPYRLPQHVLANETASADAPLLWLSVVPMIDVDRDAAAEIGYFAQARESRHQSMRH